MDACIAPVRAAELRLLFHQKCAEETSLRRARDQAAFKIQQLRLRLAASGSHESVVPNEFRTGNKYNDSFPLRRALKELIEWLADKVDTTTALVYNVCGNIPLGELSVKLGRMTAWEIADSGGQRLSVPCELVDFVTDLLAKTRARGMRACEADVSTFQEAWGMVGTEVAATEKTTVPAIILHERLSQRGIVVAAWPCNAMPKAPVVSADPPLFEPAKHFASLLRGPAPSQAFPAPGDRVEAKFEGEWYAGVLARVVNDAAEVLCDVDEPGIVTVVALEDVRPAASPAAADAGTTPAD